MRGKGLGTLGSNRILRYRNFDQTFDWALQGEGPKGAFFEFLF